MAFCCAEGGLLGGHGDGGLGCVCGFGWWRGLVGVCMRCFGLWFGIAGEEWRGVETHTCVDGSAVVNCDVVVAVF